MLTLLIADDEYFILERLKRMADYAALGYELAGAFLNGREAMQQIEERQPDLAILDIKMPFLSGLEIAEQVQRKGLRTKIILLTSYDYFDFAKQAIQFEVISYLLKPVKEKELVQALTEARGKLEAQKDNERLREQFAELQAEQALYAFLTHDTPPGAPDRAPHPQTLQEARLLLFGKVDNPEGQPDLLRAAKDDFRTCDELPTLFWLPCSDNTLCLLLRSVPAPARAAARAQALLAARFGVAANVLYGEVADCTDLPALFSAVQSAMADSVFGEGNLVADVARLSSRLIPHRHIDIRDALTLQMRSGDSAGLRALLSGAFDQLGREAPSAYNLELLLSEVLTACAILRGSGDSARESSLSLSIHELLSNHLTCASICDWCIQYAENQLRAGGNPDSDLTSSITELIDASYSDPELSLPYIAQKVGYAANYISTAFKKSMGLSVVQYITQRRMLEAKRLLTDCNMQVNQVCQRVGYSNPFYFSKRFKQFYGFSPSECCHS